MVIISNFENSEESLNDTTPASFAVSAFSLNRLRDPACSTTTFLPSKHMELLLRMARLGRTHSVIKLLLMYIEDPQIIGHRKLSVDSLIVVCKSTRILDAIPSYVSSFVPCFLSRTKEYSLITLRWLTRC